VFGSLTGGLEAAQQLRHLGLEFSVAHREAVPNVLGATDHSFRLPQFFPCVEEEIDGLRPVAFRDRQAIPEGSEVVFRGLMPEGEGLLASHLVGKLSANLANPVLVNVLSDLEFLRVPKRQPSVCPPSSDTRRSAAHRVQMVLKT
jgi:hypothetical protein